MPESIHSLGLLPCEPEDYLTNIVRVLRVIRAHDSVVNQDEIIDNLRQQSVEERLSNACLKVSNKLDLIERRDSLFRLSAVGLALAKVDAASQESLLESLAYQQLLHYLEDWYVGFEEVIYEFAHSLIYRSARSLGDQPYDVEERIVWLVALGLLHQHAPRYKLIRKTAKLLQYDPYPERSMNQLFNTDAVDVDWLNDTFDSIDQDFADWFTEEDEEIDEEVDVTLPVSESQTVPVKSDIRHELLEASSDSDNPQRFEDAIATAFKLLGYEVQQFGEKNTTDVVLQAILGDLSYRAIVDAKTHKAPYFYDLEPATLLEHKKHHEADYVVVVARQFSQGKVLRQAENHGIILLPLATLEQWLDYHEKLPANVLTYKAFFEVSGEVRKLPDDVVQRKKNRLHMINAVSDIIDVLLAGYTKSMMGSWTIKQIYTALNMRYEQAIYSLEDITIAVDFVCHPMIACAKRSDETIFLTGNRQMLQDSLHRIAILLDNQ